MNFFEKHVSFIDCVAFDGLYVGYRSYSNQSTFGSNTRIGRFCSIGRRCSINASRHPTNWLSTHPYVFDERYSQSARSWSDRLNEVTIGNDVWIGDNVVVLSGVTVGDGAIIGAGSVVTKDVEPYSICVGVPSRIQRMRFDDATIRELLEIRWWEYEESLLQNLPFSDVTSCIATLRQRILSDEFHKLPAHFERVRKKHR